MGFLAALAPLAISAIGSAGAAAGGIGAALGSTFAGAAGATAASAASSALSLGGISTALSTAGGVLSGISAYQQGMFQKSVAEQNEQISLQNQRTALEAGNTQESLQRLRTGQMVGREVAGAAAQGIDVGTGSPLAVQAATKLGGDMDALMIRYNAARQAYGYTVQADQFKDQATIAGRAAVGGLVSGLFQAGSSFLSGSSSLADKWLNAKLNVPGFGGQAPPVSFGDSAGDFAGNYG